MLLNQPNTSNPAMAPSQPVVPGQPYLDYREPPIPHASSQYPRPAQHPVIQPPHVHQLLPSEHPMPPSSIPQSAGIVTPQYAYARYPYLNPASVTQAPILQTPTYQKVPSLNFPPQSRTPVFQQQKPLQLQQQPQTSPLVAMTPNAGTSVQRNNVHSVYSGTVSLMSQHLVEYPGKYVNREILMKPDPDYSCPESPMGAMTTKVSSIRKRSSTACDKCRQKKIKCDNIKPRCGSCTRNDVLECHYSVDSTSPESWLSDAAYHELLSKLDLIMKELKTRTPPVAFTRLRLKHRKIRGRKQSPHVPQWDASFTSLLKWPFLQKQLGIDGEETGRHIGKILAFSEESNVPMPRFGSLQEQFDACTETETDFRHHLGSHLNAFLINSHTKAPFLDIVELFELLEILTLLRKADASVTLPVLLREYYTLKSTQSVGNMYSRALSNLDIEDSKVLQKAYRALCESVPVLLIVCAIGVISAPVALDNIGTYGTSLEERSSGTHTKKKASIEPPLSPPSDRFALSQMYINYASMILAMFPQALKRNTVNSTKYHVLLSQYYHYTLNPFLAHEEIVTACNQLVYLIEQASFREGFVAVNSHDASFDSALINRLYWTCVKLECELNVELSPYVPPSAMARISPPSSFFRIPDPFQESEHTRGSIQIANKYDDQNTWYFFLTEIAVRKVDNSMLNEVYPLNKDVLAWEDPEFTSQKVWRLIIKYVNQLNGIVDSLTPAIRKFVLLETDEAHIYALMDRKATRKRKLMDEEEKHPQVLDDFLVDEDLLHQAQSESVMCIKTRIIASKMLLIRPILYMYLHDHILFDEIMDDAMGALAQQRETQLEDETPSCRDGYSSTHSASDGSIYLLAAALNFLNCDDAGPGSVAPALSARQAHSRRFTLDSFSDLVGYADGGNDEDHEEARKRIIRWFVDGFISVPKLNIPKLGLLRHPGSWYYVRNLMMSTIFQFLAYKKTQGYVMQMTSTSRPPSADTLEVLSLVFKKENIQQSLEHALLIADYWKDERKDCRIYGEYLRQCLERL